MSVHLSAQKFYSEWVKGGWNSILSCWILSIIGDAKLHRCQGDLHLWHGTLLCAENTVISDDTISGAFGPGAKEIKIKNLRRYLHHSKHSASLSHSILALSHSIQTPHPTHLFSSFLCRRTIVCLFHCHQKKGQPYIWRRKPNLRKKMHIVVSEKKHSVLWLSGWDRVPVNTCVTIRLRQGDSQHLCDYQVETGCQSTLVWLSGWDRVPVNICVSLFVGA